MKLLALNAPWSRSIEFLITDGNSVATNIAFQQTEPGARRHPTFRLEQELMDNLWQCGLRPTEGQGSAGSLKATQNHLEDMRGLVFRGEYTKQ